MDAASERRRALALRDPVLLCAALLASYLLIPFVLRGFRFPVGPDASVYLWWIGLAGHEGLSTMGNRAGLPAVALVLSQGLGIAPVTLLAGFQCAVGTAVGLAASALVAGDGQTRRAALICGYLTGVFAMYVAAGYFSTLTFVAVFLGAVTALALGTSRGAVLAAAMLCAAGITHPELAALGVLVLVVAAAFALRAGERQEAARTGAAAVAGAVSGAMLGLSLTVGPGYPTVDTSRDTFLIRAGLSDLLEGLYIRRIFLHGLTYVPFASVPLAIVGLPQVSGFLRRTLAAWGGVTIVVIVVGAFTGWFPAERALSAALVLPILAGLGIERLLGRRTAVASAVAIAGAVAIVAGAGWTWWHAAPPVYEVEAARASDAARYAVATPVGTPLVFQVTGSQPVLTFFATRAANEIRAAMPPDRIRDVYVVVPPPGDDADEERRALSATYEADVAAAADRSGLDPLVFRLTPFIRGDFPEPSGGLPPEVSRGVRILGTAPTPAEALTPRLAPTTLPRIVATAAGVLAVLTLAGAGWTRAAAGDRSATWRWSPVVGLGMLTLVAVVVERIGASIAQAPGAIGALALTTLGGWALSTVRR